MLIYALLQGLILAQLYQVPKKDGRVPSAAKERLTGRSIFSNNETSVYDTTYFKSFAAGVDINASVKYKKYLLYFNFSKGISDRTNVGDAARAMRNQVFTVGLGYYFK